jgi:hypothetical protein
MVQAANNECCGGLLFPPRNGCNKAGGVPTFKEGENSVGKWHKFFSVSKLPVVSP